MNNIYVNEANSKHSQISRSMLNFQGKILICKEFQAPIKKTNSNTFQGVQRYVQTP